MNTTLNSNILLEVLLTFLYLVPISFFRYIPFKKHFRFSVRLTVLLYFTFFFAGNQILVLFGKYNLFITSNRFRFILYFCMTLFSFFLVKDFIGKQLYVICFYANYSFLFSAATLVPEALIYGKNSLNLTFKVVGMIIVLVAAMPLIYHFSFKPLSTIVNRNIPKIWNFLWIAGLIQLLLNAGLSIPYRDNDIWIGRNAVIRLSISIGSILLNHILLYLIKEMMDANDENNTLAAEKQQLVIQEYQYRSLQSQIENSRHFRHDFKHHSAIIASILSARTISDSERLEKLTQYCKEYFGSVPKSEEQHFCDHYPLNLILNYYNDRALENKYSFVAKVNVPSQMAIPDTELCVIVGNLLMNATEAVTTAPSNIRQITINVTKNNTNLLILVENGFDGQLNMSGEIFHSTKHKGDGIGIPSIQNIAAKYNGNCYFDHEGKIFSSRIHLFLEY